MSDTDQLTFETPAAKAEPAPPAKPPRSKPPAVAAASPWRPMGTPPNAGEKGEAPYDGCFVYLLGDAKQGEWYWYTTRQFRKGCWQPIAWWRMRMGENSPPKFSPGGWRPVAEGVPK